MRPGTIAPLLAALLALWLLPAGTVGQEVGTRLTLLTGGAAFSAFQNQRVEALRLSDGESRRFDRSVSAASSVGVGLHVEHWRQERWGVRLAGGYVPSRFSVRYEQRDRAFLEEGGSSSHGDEDWADLTVWTASAAVVLRLPSGPRRVRPYGVAGAGVVVYHAADAPPSRLPIGAREEFESSGRRVVVPAVLLGLGTELRLRGSGLSLVFEISNAVTGATFDRYRASVEEREDVRLTIHPESTPRGGEDSGRVRLVNHLSFGAGFVVPLRR